MSDTTPATGPVDVDALRAWQEDGDVRLRCFVGGREVDLDQAGGDPGRVLWVTMVAADDDRFARVARALGLEAAAVDTVPRHRDRPAVLHVGSTVVVLVRTATYDEEDGRIRLGHLDMLLGPGVLLLRHEGDGESSAIEDEVAAEVGLARRGAPALVHALVGAVVDGYADALDGVEDDVVEVAGQVFDRDPVAPKQIYELSREVLAFERAARALHGVVERLQREPGEDDRQTRRWARTTEERLHRVTDRVESASSALADILVVSATLASQDQNDRMARLAEVGYAQNEQVKKISAWAAILIVPTVVTGVYGMNFRHMPELDWTFGYPASLALMGALAGVLYLSFRRRGWL